MLVTQLRDSLQVADQFCQMRRDLVLPEPISDANTGTFKRDLPTKTGSIHNWSKSGGATATESRTCLK
eukprot:m.494208 g.494208  ORF g.494208 m.494208 type:complete len:68 (+) comp57288_c0_seq17:2744-2947(+)